MKKGSGKLIIAGALFLSIVIVVSSLFHTNTESKNTTIVMVMPGIDTIEIVESATYVLWLRNNTFVDGVRYSSTSTEIPQGTEFQLRSLKDSSIIPIENAAGSSITINGESKISILKFVDVPVGTYTFMVNNLLEPQVFSLEKSKLGGVAVVFKKILYIVFAALGTLIFLIIGIIQILKKEKK